MTYSTYEFTAFTEADLLAAGADGSGVNCGDTFTMSGAATTCFEVTDNDSFLSGDNCHNENANDHYGQQAAITGEDGNELGNGGQIYAENYFWVCDDAGNWYVMIEIEQEGSGDDYFTFYTGHGYTVPEEGTELTVYSSCNVKGSWIDFDCLDAGEKGPDTGSISGRVFCDDDCDGIDGGVTIIEGCDYTIEAEDMDAWGFKTVHGAHASGGELVKLQCAGQSAAIKTDFHGKDGVYDISLFIQDETDGASKIKLLVNGHVVEAIRLDRQSDGAGSNNGGFSEFVIEGVELKAGDEIKLWAEGDGYEFVRIDKLEFNGRDEEVRTEEVGKEGVTVVLLDAHGNEILDGNGDRIETVTDANGEYTFDGVPVGDYRVKFENPDGTEFTFQNAGSDDTIDSDVDANGVSDVVSVVADQTTSDIDAGLKPVVELGSIAGRYFCDENDDGAETDAVGNFEAGVAGATVWLLLGGNVIASTTTDADGNYSFADLDAGNYSVRFEDPDDVSSATEGKNFIAADQGDDATDSDVVNVGDAGNGNTATFTLGAGENKTDVDGGIKQQFMVCDDPDAVLIDFEGLDNDVGFEAFEAGRVIDDEYAQFGVTISAQRLNNNDAANDAMVFDSANPTGGDDDLQTFNQGNLLIVSEDNDSSDPDDAVGGVITFDFENPSRVFDLKVVDTEEGGTIALFDADGNSLGVIDLPNLQDGGLEQVMIDVDGVSQMVVTLNGSGAIDDICIVPGQPAPGSLSGRYFFDEDRDGLDNDGANGISGIQVELLDENGAGLGIFETTDGQGNYSFGDLDAGTYGVKFTDPDTGRELTAQNVGMNEAIDSDAADVGGGMSAINGIVVVAGADTPDNDAGVVEKAGSLSGTYFCDDNRDGDDDGAVNGDADIAGKTVMLFEADGVTPATDIDGNPVAAAITGANGDYSFANLAAGDYVVMFEATDGKSFIAANAAADDVDSDVVDAANGKTAPVTVNAGEETTDVDAGVSLDLGSLSGRYFCDDDGDGLDNDGANGGEGLGVDGFVVTLLDANNAPVLDANNQPVTTITGPNGAYSFTGLVPGIYGVSIAGTPVGKEFTTANVGMNDAIDSDALADDFGGAVILGIEVFGGQDTPDNDAGVKPSNEDPEADDVMAAVCADDMAVINLIDQVSDPDGDMVSITSISDDDETAGVGESITLEGGGVATLNADGTVSFDPGVAYADLEIRDSAMDQFQFTATDSNGGTATAMADLKICGALNTIETIAEGFVDADGAPLQASYRVDFDFGGDDVSFPTTVIANAPLDSRLEAILGPDGVRTFDDNFAYCVDREGLLEFGVDAPSNLYIIGDDAMNTSNSAIADAVIQEENLDIVTWILNQGFQDIDAGTLDDGDLGTAGATGENYSFGEVQNAIWFFTDAKAVDASADGVNTQEIIDLAITEGGGFVAGEGDKVAVLFDPLDEDRQTYIVGVDFETLQEDCDCIL